MARIDRAADASKPQASSNIATPDPASTTAETTPPAGEDAFSVRSDGEAPVLVQGAASTETPAELKAALLNHHVSQRRPGKNTRPKVQARTAGTPSPRSQQPGQTARLRNRAAENMVRAQVDTNLSAGTASTPAPFGGMGMGAAQATDPKELRAKLTSSAGWADLSPADQATLTERFDTEGPAGAGTRMRLGSLMNHPRWQAAGSAAQTEALSRVASQPAPRGPMGMGMGGMGGEIVEQPPAPSVRETQSNLQASDGFRALSASEQRSLTARVKLDGRRGESTRRIVQSTMQSPEWALLDTKGRAQQLRTAQMRADSSARFSSPQQVTEDLEASAGFAAMGPEEQAALRERAAKPGEMALRGRLGEAMKLPEFERASPQRQASVLRQIAEDTPVFKMPTKPAAGAAGMGAMMMMGGPGTEPAPAPSAQALQGQLNTSGALRHLAADERKALTTRLQAGGEAGEALRGALGRTMDSPQWSLRTSEERAQGLRTYLGDTRSWPTSGDAAPGTKNTRPRAEPLTRDAMAEVKALPGYALLTTDEQSRFEGLMSGQRNPLSREARRQVSSLTYGLQPDTPRMQAEGLRTFLKEGPHVPGNMDSIDVVQSQRFEPRLGAARSHADFQFRGATQDATVQTVRINGHSVDIYAPATPPDLSDDAPHLPSTEDIASALAHLPPESLQTVERVVINPVRNPDDGYWAEQMERPGFRANATAGRDGNMTFYPMTSEMTREELGDIARHEAGHFNSFDTLYENEGSLQSYLPNWAYGSVPDWEDWQEAAASDGTVASQYGAENQDEDYAEAYALYMGTRGTPLHDEYRQVFPNRFELLDGLVAGPD